MMDLKRLLDELLSMSTYGLHLSDRVIIDDGDDEYRILAVHRGTDDGQDVIRIEVSKES